MVNISVRSSCTVSDSAKNRRLYYFKVEASDWQVANILKVPDYDDPIELTLRE